MIAFLAVIKTWPTSFDDGAGGRKRMASVQRRELCAIIRYDLEARQLRTICHDITAHVKGEMFRDGFCGLYLQNVLIMNYKVHFSSAWECCHQFCMGMLSSQRKPMPPLCHTPRPNGLAP